jgi:hypothetical protein
MPADRKPRVYAPVPLESALEHRCCRLAERLGCHPVKLGGFAVGLPDRAFLLPGGGVWLVEFKTPTGEVSLRQKYHFGRLTKIGHPVEIVRSFELFKRLLHEKLGLPPPPVQKSLDLD